MKNHITPYHSPNAPILQRRNIVDNLLQAAKKYPLIVLHAPMGYGKTVAIYSLLQQYPFTGIYTAIRPGEEKAPYIWNSLAQQIELSHRPLGTTLRKLGFPSNYQETSQTLNIIQRRLAKHHILLVIDDYHLSCDPVFDEWILHTIHRNIPNLALLLSTRKRPNFALDELRIKGQAWEFDASFLAFSREDSLHYFQMHGIDDEKIASHIWQESAGWAAALWLNLQGYLKHGTKSLASQQYSINDLFDKIIFSNYEPDDQALLMQLSAMSSFTSDQATFISNINTAPQRLVKLYHDNAMLTLDASGQYHLHSMFRNYLAQKLAADKNIDHKALYRRVAQSHLKAGNMLPALLALKKAGEEQDLLCILDVFGKSLDPLLLHFDPDKLLSIMNSIPWNIRIQRPIAYLNFIYCYMTNCDIRQVAPLLTEAEKRFADSPHIAPAQKELIRGEIILIRSRLVMNDFLMTRDKHVEAHTLLKGHSLIPRKNLIWILGSPHISFQYLRKPGQFQSFVKTIYQDLHYFQDLTQGVSAGAQDIVSAEFALETGNLDSVKIHLLKSFYHAKNHRQIATYIPITFTEARLLMAQGDCAAAKTLFSTLQEQIEPICNNVLNTAYDLAIGYCAACNGCLDDIPEWLHTNTFEITHAIHHGLGFAYIVYGKSLLLRGDCQHLLAYAQSMPAFFSHYRNLLGFIHAHMLEAIAVYQTDGLLASLSAAQKAIDLAQPDNIILTIAEYGEHALPIIKKIHEKNNKSDYLTTLLRTMENYANANPVARKKTPAVCLTRREKEILQLASKGKSNHNIATHLAISPHTVAKTLSNIYQKLNAKNRIDAVRKYRQQTGEKTSPLSRRGTL